MGNLVFLSVGKAHIKKGLSNRTTPFSCVIEAYFSNILSKFNKILFQLKTIVYGLIMIFFQSVTK